MSMYTPDELNDMVILPEPHDPPYIPTDGTPGTPYKDKLAAEVTDRLLDALPVALFADMRMGDWGDPWGEMMGWWFALNDVCYALNLPTEGTYTPGACGMAGIDTDDYRFQVLYTGITERPAPPTDDDVNAWHKAFATAHHALKLLGKDY